MLAELFPNAATSDGHRSRSRVTTVSRGWASFIVASVAAGLVVAGLTAPAIGGTGIGVRESTTWFHDLPVDLPLDTPLPQRSVVYAADGKTVIAEFYGENRIPMQLSQMPKSLTDAVLSIEDDRFYAHGAVDLRGLVRAFLNNGSGGRRQGGSTLTQQYVKNVLLTNASTAERRDEVTAKTLDRKLREARLAVEVERRLGKDKILEGYLNASYFGRGAYGVGAAARRWFGKPLESLTLPETALLAGMLKNPAGYDPINHVKVAKIRRDVVISRMVETGRLGAAAGDAAKATPLKITLTTPVQGCASSPYPFFCQYVRDTIETDPAFGATPEAREALLYRGGLHIVTTLNRSAMLSAQYSVSHALSPRNRITTAIAIVRPGSGEVVALATSKRWGTNARRGQTELVLPTLPAFQPGSTFKPITLATALEQGISPYARFDTPNGYIPARMNYPKGGFHNDDDRGHGSLDAYGGMAGSVNTFFVQLIERTGVLPVADMAARLGMTSLPRSGPKKVGRRDAALTLGAFETSPLDMATVYATLAARGIACRPIVIRSMTGPNGSLVAVPKADCHRVLAPGVADTVNAVLQGVFSGGGTGSGLALNGHEAIGKTGTTNNHGATWFAGATPQYAGAVWVGDIRGPQYPVENITAYGQSYGTVYGRTVAGPIWRETFYFLHRRLPALTFPAVDASTLANSVLLVPDVRGLTLGAAVAALTSAGYRVGLQGATAAPDAAVPPGVVVSQTPQGGLPLGPAGQVVLVMSAGSDTRVRIPTS